MGESKFIDPIKDGKINVDSSFLFTVKSEDKIGIKAGITEQEGGQDEILLKATDIPFLATSTSASSIPGSFAGKLIPTLDKLEEFVVDKGGSSNYCLYTGASQGSNGLTPLPIEGLPSVLNVSSTAGTDPANQTAIKIEPKYYQLVFIMKIE